MRENSRQPLGNSPGVKVTGIFLNLGERQPFLKCSYYSDSSHRRDSAAAGLGRVADATDGEPRVSSIQEGTELTERPGCRCGHGLGCIYGTTDV